MRVSEMAATARRWQAAVTCLRLGTQRVQVTADALPTYERR
jgi:hypothetical protein